MDERPPICTGVTQLKEAGGFDIADYVAVEVLVVIVALLLVVNIVICCYYRRGVRKEMKRQGVIRSGISQYIAVQQQNRRSGTHISDGSLDSSRS